MSYLIFFNPDPQIFGDFTSVGTPGRRGFRVLRERFKPESLAEKKTWLRSPIADSRVSARRPVYRAGGFFRVPAEIFAIVRASALSGASRRFEHGFPGRAVLLPAADAEVYRGSR